MIKNLYVIGVKDIIYVDNVVKVFIVGVGMVNNSGVAVMMFEVFYDVGINIEMILIFEIKILVLIDEKDVEKVVRVIYDKFKFYFLNSNGK